MNIERVNAVLSKALVQIQEGESESLRELVLSESSVDEEPTPFEAAIDALADQVMEDSGATDEAAIDAIIEAAGEMADQGELPDLFGIEDPTLEDVNAWINAVVESKLVEGALQRLA